MHRLPGVSIKLFEREYDLAFGRQASGANWLMAVNKESDGCVLLTPFDGPSLPANAIVLLDFDDMVPALEVAGIVKREGPTEEFLGVKLCRCEIVHTDLIERLAELDVKNIEMQREHEGHSR